MMFPFTKREKPKTELKKSGVLKYKCRNCGEIFNEKLAEDFHSIPMYAEHECNEKITGCADLWCIDFPNGKNEKKSEYSIKI
jgi:hypothetical protein